MEISKRSLQRRNPARFPSMPLVHGYNELVISYVSFFHRTFGREDIMGGYLGIKDWYDPEIDTWCFQQTIWEWEIRENDACLEKKSNPTIKVDESMAVLLNACCRFCDWNNHSQWMTLCQSQMSWYGVALVLNGKVDDILKVGHEHTNKCIKLLSLSKK